MHPYYRHFLKHAIQDVYEHDLFSNLDPKNHSAKHMDQKLPLVAADPAYWRTYEEKNLDLSPLFHRSI